MSDTILLFKEDAERAIVCVKKLAALAILYVKSLPQTGLDDEMEIQDNLTLVTEVLNNGYIPTTCDGNSL